MLATGQLSPDVIYGQIVEKDSMYGMEFAGRDAQGKRVMGILNVMGIATTVLPTEFILEVPDKWTLQEAATIPVVYYTAYLALFIKGKMNRGDSILIHVGSGGVGIACINIALHTGCKVFTTVGCPIKREFLKRTFPQLSDQ